LNAPESRLAFSAYIDTDKPGFFTSNVFGLSLGVAAALFVVLLLRSELSYDRHFRDSGRIFRVVTPEYTGGPYVLSRRLLDEVPEVEEMCAIKQAYSASFYGQVVLTVDGRRRIEGRLFHAEPSFFRLFDSTFIHGRPETALAHPRAVVLRTE
jgi:putative ABC transport system permease protein